MIQKKKCVDSVPWHDARSFHSSLTSDSSRMTSVSFGQCDCAAHFPEQIATNEARFMTRSVTSFHSIPSKEILLHFRINYSQMEKTSVAEQNVQHSNRVHQGACIDDVELHQTPGLLPRPRASWQASFSPHVGERKRRCRDSKRGSPQ